MNDLTLRFTAALLGEELEFVEGNVLVTLSEGMISSISTSEGSFDVDLRGFMVMPPTANMHVHVLDYGFPEYGNKLSIEDLVGEPHGLKYRLLLSASKERLLEALRRFKVRCSELGVGFIMEFRELGVKGLTLDAGKRPYGWLALAMPLTHRDDSVKAEIKELVKLGDGLGISSPLYFSDEVLQEMVKEFKIRGKPVAAHISETRETWLKKDFNSLRTLNPDAVVHGTWLRRDELEIIKELGATLVLCVRSNLWFSTGIPRLTDIYSLGIDVALGTDNCAWIEPSPWREAETLLLLLRYGGVRDSRWVLKALVNARPAGILNRLVEGGQANLLILKYSGTSLENARDKYSAIIKRGEDLVSCLIMNGELRYCGEGLNSLRNRIRNNVS